MNEEDQSNIEQSISRYNRDIYYPRDKFYHRFCPVIKSTKVFLNTRVFLYLSYPSSSLDYTDYVKFLPIRLYVGFEGG